MARLTALEVLLDGDSTKLVQAVERGLRSMEKLEKDATSAGGSVKRSLETAGGIQIAGLVDRVADLGAGVLKTAYNYRTLREQSEIAFKTMLGSGERAKVFLDDLQRFAAKTPFEFPDLVRASERMLAMGFAAHQIVPTLTAVGDAAGGNAEKIDRITMALSQMLAKGKPSAEEMLQLAEAGIPAWQFLADKIGKSVPEAMKLVEKGAISARSVVDAQVEGMTKKYGGMMEANSKTLQGMVSTARDVATQSSRVIGPLFDLATQKLDDLLAKTGTPEWENNLDRIELKFYDIARSIDYNIERAGALLDRLGQANSFKLNLPGTGMLNGLGIGDIADRIFPLTPNNIKGYLGTLDRLNGGAGGSSPSGPAGIPTDRSFREMELRSRQQIEARIKSGEVSQEELMVLESLSQARANETRAAQQQTAATNGLAAASGGAKEKVLTLAEALADSVLKYAEALELHLTPAQAGQLEAQKQLEDRYFRVAEAAFEFDKMLSKLEATFAKSDEAGRDLVLTMQKEQLEKNKAAAIALFGQNTQEQAAMALQIAKLDAQLAGTQIAGRPFVEQREAQRRGIENDVARLNAEKDRLGAMKLDTSMIENLIKVRQAEAKNLEGAAEALTGPLNKQRENLMAEANLMDANIRVRQAEIEAADKMLLSDAEHSTIARELLDYQKQYSRAVRDGTTDFRNLLTEVGLLYESMRLNRRLGIAPGAAAGASATDVQLAGRGVAFTPPRFGGAGGLGR